MAEHGTKRMGRMAGVTRTAGALTTLLLISVVTGRGAAVAQETDERWLAWLGCWHHVTDEAATETPESLLCVQPLAGDAGVEVVSVQGGSISARRAVRANGQRYDSSVGGCTGWDRADFSARPTRLFLSSEYECEGDDVLSSGLWAMLSPEDWVVVEVVTEDGRPRTWITRYRPATQAEAEAAGFGDIEVDLGREVRLARLDAAMSLSVDDVIEAFEHVAEEGVSAWIAERDIPFELDADRLIRLADAGVSEDVIDVMIAVSYPSHFAVGRDRYDSGFATTSGAFGASDYYQPFYSSLFYSPFGFYSPYGHCSPYRYGFGYRGCGYGYGGYGGYGYGGHNGPVVIYVDRAGSGGRVINGQGYRRSPDSGSNSGRAATRRGYVGGSSGTRAASGSSAGTSTTKSTGRKAKRKDGGGGD